MKKTRKNAGFSLIELVCTLLILVLLVMGIGVGMDTGSKIYRDATFESDSAMLAGILNTSLGDYLRYAEVMETDTMSDLLPSGMTTFNLPYVYTNYEYGIRMGYFYLPIENNVAKGSLKIKSLHDEKTINLVNAGAYPDMQVQNFQISFTPRDEDGVEGGYCVVTYEILSKNDASQKREVEMIVRLMND